MNHPVFFSMPDKIPDGYFGIGYPFIHNVYRGRDGAASFSYHYVKSILC